ncbi:MAG TPA: Hsp20/alpha crystallin family protein [Woeseiaceae bacterium]|nr:Hsp20/alpha crystallin family protein [Woeseiaceae bacterium]
MAIRSVRSIHLMWSQACDSMDRADRLHRQFYRLGQVGHLPAWEPPVDVFEGEGELLVRIALPDVDPGDFKLSLVDGGLVLSGRRRLPPEAAGWKIHQLEIPYGRLERHVPLPGGQFRIAAHRYENGCLEIQLQRKVRDE